jgi:two-component system chemotaxis response regulator CheY
MPVLDGVQLTTFLKNNDKTKQIPILMITTKSSKNDIILAIKSGVNDYIVKPIVPAHLEQKIKNLITNIQNNKES